MKLSQPVYFLLLSVLVLFSRCGSSPQPTYGESSGNDSTTPLILKMYTTSQSAGIVSPFSNDDNRNNSATLYYRPVGSNTWQEGHAMSLDSLAREWRVSLVYLAPDTGYEIEVRYKDPDGVSPATVAGTLRTRPNYPSIGANGTIRIVPTDGSLQTVIHDAAPGDTIQLLSGVYYEGDLLLDESDAGEPGKYITIEPAPGATVILDGSEPSINSGQDNWSFYSSSAQGDIYYTDLSWGSTDCDNLTPRYVGELVQQQGVRYLLFDSGSDDWDEDFSPAPPGKAYYVCDDSGLGPAGRLYVVTYSGDDPGGHEIHIARHGQAFRLRGADYIRIRGVEIRYYGWYGIHLSYSDISGSDHNIIENNIFHGIGQNHVEIEGKSGYEWSSNNLVQHNHFYEKGYRASGWTWEVEYKDALGATVGLLVARTGHGNVIRGNRFDGGHDGIHVNVQSSDVDVYDNTITECMDDGIEIDNQPGQNIRLWNNAVTYCYASISLQDWNGPGSGPVYIFRNVFIGGEDPQSRTDHTGGQIGYAGYTVFKVGSDVYPSGQVYVYHNTISLVRSSTTGTGIQGSGGQYFSNLVTRNNIWHVTGRVISLRSSTTIVSHDLDCDNLHDLKPTDDVFIQWSSSGGPNDNGIYRTLSSFQTSTRQELHGISDARTIFDSDMSLKPGSPDIDAGCIVKGFNDREPNAFRGLAPDIGAFEGYGYLSSAIPASQAIQPGGIATYTLLVQSFGGFTSSVVLLPPSPPTGLTLTLYSTVITPPGQTILTLRDHHTGTLLLPGLWHLFPITATSEGFTQIVSIGLLVGGSRSYLPTVSRH